MTATEIAKTHGIETKDVQRVMSKPCGGGIIRVYIAKVKRTFHIYDDSDRSQGYHVVVGEQKMRDIIGRINLAAVAK